MSDSSSDKPKQIVSTPEQAKKRKTLTSDNDIAEVLIAKATKPEDSKLEEKVVASSSTSSPQDKVVLHQEEVVLEGEVVLQELRLLVRYLLENPAGLLTYTTPYKTTQFYKCHFDVTDCLPGRRDPLMTLPTKCNFHSIINHKLPRGPEGFQRRVLDIVLKVWEDGFYHDDCGVNTNNLHGDADTCDLRAKWVQGFIAATKEYTEAVENDANSTVDNRGQISIPPEKAKDIRMRIMDRHKNKFERVWNTVAAKSCQIAHSHFDVWNQGISFFEDGTLLEDRTGVYATAVREPLSTMSAAQAFLVLLCEYNSRCDSEVLLNAFCHNFFGVYGVHGVALALYVCSCIGTRDNITTSFAVRVNAIAHATSKVPGHELSGISYRGLKKISSLGSVSGVQVKFTM